VFIKPAVEHLKEEFPQVIWKSVNIQNDPEGLAISFNVTVVPTIVVQTLTVDRKVVVTEKQTGTNIAGYYRIIRSALKSIQQLSK
jgi:hypothetical protein